MGCTCINLLFSCTCIFVFCFISRCYCIDFLDSQFPKQFFSSLEQEKPNQFVINRERDAMIVRGNGGIYELNDKLEQIKTVPTSSFSDGNDNYLMVIAPDSERLLICHYNGKCEIRNSTDYTLMSNELQSVYACTQGQKMKTFVGTASELSQYHRFMPVFGSTYCGDYEKNFILASDISNLSPLSEYRISLKDQNVAGRYPVYFRTVIQYSKFILFFTNQKISVNSQVFTSKIIKICKETTTIFRVTYEDIPITCNTGDKEYRLLQHATLLNVSENDELSSICQNKSDCAVIIGIFSSGNNPENPELSSVVCVFAVGEMLQTFRKSRKRNFVGVSNQYDGGYMTFIGDRYNLSEQYYDSLTDLSGTNFCSYGRPIPINIMGNESLQGRALHESQNTRFTKIESLMTNGFAHVYIGTSDGKLLELYIKNSSASRVIGQSITVEDGKAVKEMGQLNGHIYAMTENKIVKVGNVNCTKYTNCEECMKVGNPACGWSILTEKCMKLEDLRDGFLKRYWLPAAQQKCATLTLDKIGVRIDQFSVDVYITTDPPINIADFTGVTFKCKYGGLGNKGIPVVGNKCSGIQSKYVHGQNWFYLVAELDRSSVVVAKTLFWTYNCTKFESCSSCIEIFHKKINCFWCKEIGRCAKNTADCVGSISTYVMTTANCPALSGNKMLRIPLNVPENMTIPGKNIPVLQTKLPTPMTSTKKLNVKIYFNDRILGTTDIEAYDCGSLAKQDCSTCEHYKIIEKYSCNWCNHCQHTSECRISKNCPAPKITNMSPENSTLGGNAIVEIEGTNLGVNISDVTGFSMADISCLKIIKKPGQFQTLWCRTGPSDRERSGPVRLTVNGESSEYGRFLYKDQTLDAIKPNTIIKSGGVWLTISGRNFDIGNKHFVVTLTNALNTISCKNSSLSKENSIICFLDGYPCNSYDCIFETDYLNKLVVTFDVNTTKELSVKFNYVPNPFHVALSPSISFSSGGRILTVQGQNLKYVIKATFGNKACIKVEDVFKCTSPRQNETGTQQTWPNVEERNILLQLDGLHIEHTLKYVPDPTIHVFDGDKEYDFNTNWYLTIKGENMTRAASTEDYNVTIGRHFCKVSLLKLTYLYCIPGNKLDVAETYPVKVTVGNLSKDVGNVKQITDFNVHLVVIVVLSVIIVTIVIVVAAFLVYRKRKTR